MKKLFWSAVKAIARPGKNLWITANRERAKIKREEKDKERKKEIDKQQLLNAVKDFKTTMDNAIQKLKEKRDVE